MLYLTRKEWFYLIKIIDSETKEVHIFLTRKEAAKLLNVSTNQLEVWTSIGKHAGLHEGLFKARGTTVYYKLRSVENHLKSWDPQRYSTYIITGNNKKK